MFYNDAKAVYAKYGIDTEAALARLSEIPISMHCWQGDDVGGFESAATLSGGIQTTGNHFGKARNAKELMQDIDFALGLIPGKKRINLHAIYLITEERVERDCLLPKHFEKWIDFCKQRDLGIDFNPTLFSHPMASDGLTLSHPDKKVRDFWIRHVKATRKIAEYCGKQLGTPCLHNIWIPDGLKDIPADRLTPRLRLKDSLDQIFADKVDSKYVIDALESKVFGIGVESYTVGSNEFYLNYAAKNNICCLLDNGHYHPTEYVSDKIPSMLVFSEYVALHVTRSVRWDSDHVVLLDDELKEMAKEIIRNNADSRVLIGLDYFDASINRISAFVTGMQSMQKALLLAILQPIEQLKKLQDEFNFTKLMALSEEAKVLPFYSVWTEYLKRNNLELNYSDKIESYENEFLKKRTK